MSSPTQCSPQTALKSYILQINPDDSQQPFHAIIGPGCSSAAQPVAELAHLFNLIQVL